MWDLHQNGWCKAQTEPVSQLDSLRNCRVYTNTRTRTRTHTFPPSLLLVSVFLRHFCILKISWTCSRSFTPSLTISNTHTDVHKHTPLCLGTVLLAFRLVKKKRSGMVEIKMEGKNGMEWVCKEEKQRILNSSHSFTKNFSFSCRESLMEVDFVRISQCMKLLRLI